MTVAEIRNDLERIKVFLPGSELLFINFSYRCDMNESLTWETETPKTDMMRSAREKMYQTSEFSSSCW